MDVRYVNPFINSTKCVFSTMLATDVFISKPVLKSDEDQRADVSAIIGLSGDAVGCVALCFPMASAVRAASKFSGTEMAEDHENFSDAMGELANMVAGQAKANLDGLNCSISLPNVIIGKQHIIAHLSGTPRLALPCDSGLGRFCVEVGMVLRKHPSPEPVSANHDCS